MNFLKMIEDHNQIIPVCFYVHPSLSPESFEY